MGEWASGAWLVFLAGVAAGEDHLPDWRDAAAYQPLLGADRSFFAWEWLRRNPHYRAAAERSLQAGSLDDAGSGDPPLRWGLHAFEPPGAAVPEARPVWSADVHPDVLAVEAGPAQESDAFDDAFDLGRFDRLSTLVPAVDGGAHLLISDGLRTIRIDVIAGSLASGPCVLRYRLAGLASAERPLLTLRRFLALWQTGGFSRTLHPAETRAKRWLLMLRARDALAAGADQREIAALLLSQEAHQPRWRNKSPSVRSRVQRLVRSSRAMETGGFWALLSGASTPSRAPAAIPQCVRNLP